MTEASSHNPDAHQPSADSEAPHHAEQPPAPPAAEAPAAPEGTQEPGAGWTRREMPQNHAESPEAADPGAGWSRREMQRAGYATPYPATMPTPFAWPGQGAATAGDPGAPAHATSGQAWPSAAERLPQLSSEPPAATAPPTWAGDGSPGQDAASPALPQFGAAPRRADGEPRADSAAPAAQWSAPQPAPAAPWAPPAYPAGPSSGAAWPSGWGTPPPTWDPPAATPPAGPLTRRPVALVGAATLAVGLAVGAVGTVLATRGLNSGSHTATLLVDDTSPKGHDGTAVSVAETLGPAVGTIIAKTGSSNALGSGFVIAHGDGNVSYLLTNNHVVSGAKDLHVVMPGGRNLAATVVGVDSFDDLAVISVPDGSLPVATFGKSSELKVGEEVVAIGSPLGNQGSVTEGVISALHRTISAGSDAGGQSEQLQDVLQTDASINKGNSGGPLADVDGRVVGVNVAIAGDASNIGFSIPADLAQVVARELIGGDKVEHPYLGIAYLTSIEAIENGSGFDGPGVLVQEVRSGSPAEKAGFHKGDILQAVDGTSIDNGETLGGLIQRHKVGDTVQFTVKRGSSILHLSAALVDRPSS